MIYLKCVPNYVGGKKMFVFFSYSHSPGTRLAEVTRYCQGKATFSLCIERFDWRKGYKKNLKVSLCCQLNLSHTFVKPSSTGQATLIHIGL